MADRVTLIPNPARPVKPHESEANVIHCSVAGYNISLEVADEVFRPTLTTAFLTKQVLALDLRERTVLDLGCGTGPIAIALALAGAKHVFATDIMRSACDLARRNARLNGVSERMSVVEGDLFRGVETMKFDIVVDDVSGVAEEVARLSSWFPPCVATGGVAGTSLTVRMLRESSKHVKPGGHLYFPVLSLSQSETILATARELFAKRLTCVATKLVPFNNELKRNIGTLTRLQDAGLISFQRMRSRLFWTLKIYRVTPFDDAT